MGCAAFTPKLVGLASELEGEPLHVVASYNQNGDASVALREIFENGMPIWPTNLTATISARHPDVTGITYVPYTLVFDPHGDLVYHHQSGPYHGGNGDAVLEQVRAMLHEVPAIYVGKEPYDVHAKLAKEISNGKALRKQLDALQAALAESPEDPELARLVVAVERHASNAVQSFERSVVDDPKRALAALDRVAREYDGTPWGEDLVAAAKRASEPATRKRYEASGRKLAVLFAAWEKLEGLRANAGVVRNPLHGSFREKNRAILDKLIPRFETLKNEYADLPAGKAADQILSVLQRPI